MPEHSIGDAIRHIITREQGRVVRTVKVSDVFPTIQGDQGKESAYVVALAPETRTPAREALWFAFEVEAHGSGLHVSMPARDPDTQ